MRVKITSNENPYVLDYVAGRTDKLPALTHISKYRFDTKQIAYQAFFVLKMAIFL